MIDNPAYKGEWVHPEIDNPDYAPDSELYKFDDIGAIGFDLWQVCALCCIFCITFTILSVRIYLQTSVISTSYSLQLLIELPLVVL